jgi:hypothetical protein
MGDETRELRQRTERVEMLDLTDTGLTTRLASLAENFLDLP